MGQGGVITISMVRKDSIVQICSGILVGILHRVGTELQILHSVPWLLAFRAGSSDRGYEVVVEVLL